MKVTRKIAGLVSLLGMVLFFPAWSASCYAQVADIAQFELMQRINTNRAGLILDVRSPEEYAEGHVPGAINIPHDQLAARLAEISAHKNSDIVLYCRSGGRVGIAAGILQAAGFSKILHLAGDMGGWLLNGNLPVKK